METNYDVCLAHLKWAPCLTKGDWENECKTVNDSEANRIIREYHAGVLDPDQAMAAVKSLFGQGTFVYGN